MKCLILVFTGCLCAIAAEDRTAAVERATQLQRNGHLQDASAVWRHLLVTNPDDLQALVMSGVLASQLRRFHDAEWYYTKALRLDPGDPVILLNLALAHFKDADLNGAIPPLQKVIAEQPDNQQAKTLLGVSYYATRNFQGALPLLEQTPGSEANNELRQMIAESYIWTGQPGKAAGVLGSLLRDSPDSAIAHMFLGEAYDGEGRSEDAVREFQEAVKRNGTEPNVHFGLGYLYWKGKNYQAAEQEFRSELALEPEHAQALAYLGDIKLAQGDAQNAEKSIRRAIALQAGIRIAHYDLGVLLQQQFRHAAAVSEFQAAIKLDPDRADAHYRVANSYRALGRTAEASAELERVRSLHQSSAEAAVYRLTKPAAVPPGAGVDTVTGSVSDK